MDVNGKNNIIGKIMTGILIALLSLMIWTVQEVNATVKSLSLDVIELKITMGQVETKLGMLMKEP